MAVIDAGIAGGKILTSGMLKYTKSVYEDKITELEGYNNRLNQHLQTLESLKSQIPGFWGASAGAKTVQALALTIEEVRSASERTANLRQIYRNTVEELDKQDILSEANLDAALEVLKRLDI